VAYFKILFIRLVGGSNENYKNVSEGTHGVRAEIRTGNYSNTKQVIVTSPSRQIPG
jgi:hypothetical protein